MREALTEAATAIDEANTAANDLTKLARVTVTVYVDGVNGNDARTGETNNSHATTGCVKTLARVAALHSGKVVELTIVIVGALTHAANVTIKAPIVFLTVNSLLTFSKRAAINVSGTIVGDGTYGLSLDSREVNILNNNGITVEAHTGSTGLGDQASYQYAQGAIKLLAPTGLADASRLQVVNVAGGATITVGNNTAFAVPGATGINPYMWNLLSRYRRTATLGGAVSLGTNAVESYFQGNRSIIRTLTPASSTDANVSEGELVADSTYLYRKNSGVIKKVAWVTF